MIDGVFEEISGDPVSGPYQSIHTVTGELVVDRNGVTHVFAAHEDDLYFLQGWVHARDRFFQMDQNRRLASGTLAELLGPDALASDVELRTVGLRRAAERSLAALLPGTRAALAAYARGVNAWLAANPCRPSTRHWS
jgi:penicillin amidase